MSYYLFIGYLLVLILVEVLLFVHRLFASTDTSGGLIICS